MVQSLGRIEPDRKANRPSTEDNVTGPPTPDVIRELHRDLIRQTRLSLLQASPLVLLAIFGCLAAMSAPQQLGGLIPVSVIVFLRVGRMAFEWVQLRRADPVALYEREQRRAAVQRAEQVDHMIRSADVVPIVSLALGGCLVLVTAIQFLSGSLGHAVSAAGLVKPAVRSGQWWRLLTATYLHGHLLHITANAGAAVAIGRVVETYDRRLRVPAVYLLAALAGSIVSTLLSSRPSVGASGGVMGLAAYVMVVAGRRPEGAPVWLRREMLRILASTAVLGIVAFMFIDNAAHAGGAAVGAALGFLATRSMRQASIKAWDAAGAIASIVLALGAILTLALIL